MSNNKKLFWLLLIFTIFSLFFINKAYHIDDPFTITISKAIGEHFIRVPQSYQGSLVLMNEVCDNPLFLGYYYAPVIKLLGDKEIWLHLFYLPFSLLSLISMYFLTRRFIGRGIFPALCLCVTPVFIVMSQNIMLDIPLLAFSLSGLAAFIYGVDRDDRRLLFLSAILATLAILTKYSGLLIILVMFTYALLASKKRFCLYLLIPLSIFSLWCLHNLIFYHRIYFLVGILMKGPGLSLEALLARAFAVLSFLSGTSICTIFLIPFLLRTRINRLLFILSLPLAACPFLIQGFSAGFKVYAQKNFFFAGYSNLEKSVLAFFFAGSFFIILLILKAGILYILKKSPDKDNLFLFLWFTFFIVFTIAVQFIAARFVLLLFPAMFLIIGKELGLSHTGLSLKSGNKFIFLPILISAIISVILAIGDYRLAGTYRDFVVSLKQKLTPGRQVYFCADSFNTDLCYGYAYYLRKYYPLTSGPGPEKQLDNAGEFVYIYPAGEFLSPVFYENCADYPLAEGYSKKLIGSFSYSSNVFLHNRKLHAGFYAHDWGLLPFYISFKKLPLEDFQVFLITESDKHKRQPVL